MAETRDRKVKVRQPFAGTNDPARFRAQVLFFRGLALVTMASGLYYIVWRYAASLNRAALWFAIPVVIAETYGVVDMILFVVMLWKPRLRVSPAPPVEGSVDVFITTYNEPVELLQLTVDAAMRIRWEDKHVWILDDGARGEMRELAARMGCGYITRDESWTGKPRHAKAGNVNNALLRTSGEFILILDADQIPAPDILERTLGYFADGKVAFVQTPQHFYNLFPGDPYGSDAPLFYGPIMQGKDGWNSAFFCGSNAVLRREALMQLGLTDYVSQMEDRLRAGIGAIGRSVRRARSNDLVERSALDRLDRRIGEARRAMDRGDPLEEVSVAVRTAIADAQDEIAAHDLGKAADALKLLADAGDENAREARDHIMANMNDLSRRTVRDEVAGVAPEDLGKLELSRSEEAIPVQALATISITEDMATAMRLHALGWKSVFHPDVLAYGLAPEDLASALKQRLRWAQGTIQVFVRENPFRKKGLTLPQKLMYFATMYSYFSGFANLMLLLSPVIYLFTGIAPVEAWSAEFFIHLLPFLVLNKIMFRYVAAGRGAWRGEQYSVALFPLWIRAVVSVLTGANPSFVVTPKERQTGVFLKLVRPQIALVFLTAAGIGYGAFSVISGSGLPLFGYLVNVFWSIYNIAMVYVVIRAATYQPPEGWKSRPPEFLFPADGGPGRSEEHTS